jgi:hypothetical protein
MNNIQAEVDPGEKLERDKSIIEAAKKAIANRVR